MTRVRTDIAGQVKPSTACWSAVGDARHDLPPWVAHELERGSAAASCSLEAAELDAQDLQQCATQAFSRTLIQLPGPPARIWTFLPRITDTCTDGLQRYMHMNIGRSSAYQVLAANGHAMPAGTCVGHAGTQLVVHAVTSFGGFQPVENPRQCPAWKYSSKFGPAAPPFVRGVRTPDALWASGTAAVRGEESMFSGDIERQWQETAANLEALRASAKVRGPWASLRAYVRDPCDCDAVTRLARATFSCGVEEVLVTPLCRAELLVEVEGIAHA